MTCMRHLSQIKNLERRTEEDVPYRDVAKHLAAALLRLQQHGSGAAVRRAAVEGAGSFVPHDDPDERPGGVEDARRGPRRSDRR